MNVKNVGTEVCSTLASSEGTKILFTFCHELAYADFNRRVIFEYL